MAEICRGVVSDTESPSSATCEVGSRAARRRRMEIRRFKFVTGISSPTTYTSSDSDTEIKRQKIDIVSATSLPSPSLSLSRECCDNAVENRNTVTEPVISEEDKEELSLLKEEDVTNTIYESQVLAVKALDLMPTTSMINIQSGLDTVPKVGCASVCGRRRDMEDAVAIHPSFLKRENDSVDELHYFAVYDGHGCSHVAMKCRDRLHELVKEELLSNKDLSSSLLIAEENDRKWKEAMERSFNRMDKEVVDWNVEDRSNHDNNNNNTISCRCELQSPDQSGAVGSTAIVAVVTSDQIIVANCGDSRAVLSRDGKAIPLSSDHKPDRPDELNRIQEAGGRVIYWDGPRVLGVLAMSRAIGDNYLKPYVSCEPEVTITDRTRGDDCLILASDGLWDVVSNDTACGVVRMCLRGKMPANVAEGKEKNRCSSLPAEMMSVVKEEVTDKACSDASTLLTKLALARHSTDNVSVVVIDLKKDT